MLTGGLFITIVIAIIYSFHSESKVTAQKGTAKVIIQLFLGAFTLSIAKFTATLSSRKIFIKIGLHLGDEGSMGKTINQ